MSAEEKNEVEENENEETQDKKKGKKLEPYCESDGFFDLEKFESEK